MSWRTPTAVGLISIALVLVVVAVVYVQKNNKVKDIA